MVMDSDRDSNQAIEDRLIGFKEKYSVSKMQAWQQQEEDEVNQLSKSFIPQMQRSSITPRYEFDPNGAPKWEQLHQLGTANSKAHKRDLREDEVEFNREGEAYTFKPDLTKTLVSK